MEQAYGLRGSSTMDIPDVSAVKAATWRNTVMLCYPPILLVTFMVSAATHSIMTAKSDEELYPQQVTGPGGKPLPVRRRKGKSTRTEVCLGKWTRRMFQILAFLAVLTFIADASTVANQLIVDQGNGWWCGEERVVYVVGGFFFHLYVLLTLVQWSNTPGIAHLIIWVITLVGETMMLVTSVLCAVSWHHVIRHVKFRDDPKHNPDGFYGPSRWELVEMVTAGVRTALFISLVFLYATKVSRAQRRERQLGGEEGHKSDSDEHTPLLGLNEESGYNTQAQSRPRSPNDAPRVKISGGIEPGDQPGHEDDGAAFYRPTKVTHKTWYEYCRGYSIFFQYLWPSDSVRLQLIVFLCILLVVWMRAINVLVPMQLGSVIRMLTSTVEDGQDIKWTPIVLFILYKSFQNNSGFIGAIRGILWVPVSQHTYKALTTAAFRHVHSLSFDFHTGKRTGELLSALNKGSAINNFLEQVTFNVLPMIFDLLVAIVFFYWEFGPVYALAVSVITFYYLHVSIQMARTRSDERREMVNKDREEEAIKNDSIVSYETVKYFNAEEREYARYGEAMKIFQKAEAKVFIGIQQMNIAQTAVFMGGIFIIVTMFAFEVSQGYRTVAEFVSMVSYLTQLQGPLNFFSSFYRTIQQAMIAGERLLELFKIKPSVVDLPDVEELTTCTGHVQWKNVKFAYDYRKPALRDLSFDCKPGTTTAFVGESGGGKSTVFRLMYRFYNCDQGSIEIDGRDVKDLSIDSVRKFIGVVPQDPNLFNESLMFNLKYANPDVTDEEVYEACRAAAIHDRIMSFPDRYDTKVGERGMRLSGGEKQRVAIARTILKKPKIIMLDEATSALDGETEATIQAKLINGRLGPDRTLLIIAHRLSTITHADQIVVLHNGMVAEKGTHEELLALKGRYSTMWDRHCRAERAVHVAKVATAKADRLLARANISGAENVHEDSDGYSSVASSSVLKPCDGASTSSGSVADSDDDSHHDDDSVCGHPTQGRMAPRDDHNHSRSPAISSSYRTRT